ncbi:MAG: SGNH/GDSL hydrolase family protein [Lacunisphaera sp.]|nr:SGNH/GDSL hydrolase family protein [Lacunisphaera sp.]
MLPANAHLLFIGDSVTDCGRARPVGAGAPPALGYGYVQLIDTELNTRHPNRTGRVTNLGTGGDTIRHLAARWETDVIAQKPDWLSAMIGINDVWRYFDPVNHAEAVPPREFAQTYETLITRTRPRLQGLVLMTPYYVEPDLAEPMRARMDEFSGLVAALAQKHGAIFVDTQAAFDRELAHTPAATLAPDRVHPSPAGHQILAQAFLTTTGVPAK